MKSLIDFSRSKRNFVRRPPKVLYSCSSLITLPTVSADLSHQACESHNKVASTSVISSVFQFFLLFLSSSLPLFLNFGPFNVPSYSLLPYFPSLFQSFILLPISLLPWLSLLLSPSFYGRHISLDPLINRSSVCQS